jgi:hypothetical protein
VGEKTTGLGTCSANIKKRKKNTFKKETLKAVEFDAYINLSMWAKI